MFLNVKISSLTPFSLFILCLIFFAGCSDKDAPVPETINVPSGPSVAELVSETLVELEAKSTTQVNWSEITVSKEHLESLTKYPEITKLILSKIDFPEQN